MYTVDKSLRMKQYEDTTYQVSELHFDAEDDLPNVYNYDRTGLNVAYFVADKDKNPVDLSEVYAHMTPEAYAVTLGENEANVPLKLRQCTEKDIDEKLFEMTRDWPEALIKTKYLKSMMCLDDPNQIHLDGQFINDDGTFLKVEWRQCNQGAMHTKSPPRCKKTDEEIGEWMKNVKLY